MQKTTLKLEEARAKLYIVEDLVSFNKELDTKIPCSILEKDREVCLFHGDTLLAQYKHYRDMARYLDIAIDVMRLFKKTHPGPMRKGIDLDLLERLTG